MHDDVYDDEEELQEDEDIEEDEDIDLPVFATPRLSLGDMFERLSGEKESPSRSARPRFGWTHEDLGGSEGAAIVARRRERKSR